MALRVDDLIQDIQDQIGIDAYHIIPEQRRLIPEAVLWGFASACLLGFLRGLVDIKSMGETLRQRIENFLSAWRSKAGFEVAVADPELPRSVEQVRIYINPLTISRSFTVRLLPPRFAGGDSWGAHAATA